jgi:hypothetical protein
LFLFSKSEQAKPHVCDHYPNALYEDDLDVIHGKDGWEVLGEVDPAPVVEHEDLDVIHGEDDGEELGKVDPAQFDLTTDPKLIERVREYRAKGAEEYEIKDSLERLGIAPGIGLGEIRTILKKVDPAPVVEEAQPLRVDRSAQEEPVEVKSVQAEPDALFLPRAHGLWPGAKRHRVFQFLRELLVRPGVYMHVDEILEKIRALDGFREIKRPALFNILSKLKSKHLLVSDNRGNWALR